MAMFRRLRGRDPAFDFFDRFGDPSDPSIGAIPLTKYPDIAINAATQIRVVQVLPGGFEDDICCQLNIKTLFGNAPTPDVEFSALSYSWGGFVNHAVINLNGVPEFPVSQNLFCCLQRIRSMGQKQWLWIDQICINQSDKKEKNLQVPLMEDIYKRAMQVIIWLGDHAPGSQLTHSRSSQLEKIISHMTFGRHDMGLCWWRRLWVLQEFSLATKEPVVQIGSDQISWTELCRFTNKYLEGVRTTFSASTSFGVLNSMIERFTAVRETSQTDRTLFALAWVFPQLICFDPRDKIYGLLGLLASDMKNRIQPDYAQAEVKAVYSHATYVDMVYAKSLCVMSLVRRDSITKGLPSWAVDFVYPQDINHMAIPVLMEPFLDLFRTPPRSWTQIAPRTDANVEYNAENASLTIAGLDFDQILLAFPVIDAKTKEFASNTSWQKMLLTTTSLTSKLVLKRDERNFRQQVLAPLDSRTAYARLLTGEEAYRSPPEYEKVGIRRILAVAIITEWLFHTAHADNPCIEDELDEDAALPEALDGYFDHLAGNFETFGSSTAFFITRKGFVGVGPRDMRSDDQIILPFGSRYPMLLRWEPNHTTWTFLSFVHVTGIGNDQLWTLFPNLKLPEQRYVLK